jgi:hypothetical protein
MRIRLANATHRKRPPWHELAGMPVWPGARNAAAREKTTDRRATLSVVVHAAGPVFAPLDWPIATRIVK